MVEVESRANAPTTAEIRVGCESIATGPRTICPVSAQCGQTPYKSRCERGTARAAPDGERVFRFGDAAV